MRLVVALALLVTCVYAQEDLSLLSARVETIETRIAGDENCDVCHLRYWHKDVANPTAFEAGATCAQYRDNSCCTAETAANVHNEVLYGDEYRWDRCYDGVPDTMSAACAAHFVNEACFYECDVHVGKWRQHETCVDDAGEENGWQIYGMPIKASECDQFYQDCKADLFCVSAESKSFFALPTCDHDTQCQTFGDIYADGKEMCELLWENSFKYESVEANAYTWSFAEGEANPNNGILPSKAFPEQCAGFDIDPTDCVNDVQKLNQKLIQVEAELNHEQAQIAKLQGEPEDHDHSVMGIAVAALVVGLISMVLAVWAMYAIMQATTKLSCLNPDVALAKHSELKEDAI